MLAGGAALAALGVVSACGESAPKAPAVEELRSPLDQARHDGALAAAAATAIGIPPQVARRADRRRHSANLACSPGHRDRPGRGQAGIRYERNQQLQSQPNRSGGTATSGVRRDRFAAHVSGGSQSTSGDDIGLPSRVARLHCRVLHRLLYGCARAFRPVDMTSSEPAHGATPKRSPSEGSADNAALCDALAVEHATIYGYGIVSALSPPGVNFLVADALKQHRHRRDDVIVMLSARGVTAPIAAAGYQLPRPGRAARPTRHD
ncbi:hypothetical protein J113_19690 [Mycobacterium tuberculosis CAS/NITR204]|uniref:DUF4439 domain-containing protein n=1 Tax=Mycobacterium tuberculosis CAS/NITR204 TaxID=1310114 RepID=R4MH82_MYCTX|nr:hypothetical protein J113_19690 [Mycobacterium tuberculosis CAS/NITR204]